MKSLKEILYKTGIVDVNGSTDIAVSNIFIDSRDVKNDSLFVAVRGTKTDGHEFIVRAIDSGATAIVCEEFPDTINKKVTYVKVRDSALSYSQAAANFFRNPSEKLKVVGVTGTNGKTTTATLLFNLFEALGYRSGLLSTVQNQIGREILPATHTTPDAMKLHELLAKMVGEQCTHCFMEVSSHAIVQKRISSLVFAGGVFTNITHDHLDYHKTFSAYIKAKKEFFDLLPQNVFALVNADDKNSDVMLQNTKAQKKSFSLGSMSDFKGKVIENDLSGMLLQIDGKEVWCKLIGRFNAYNILAAYAVATLLGEKQEKILTALSQLSPIEGRFDYIKSQNQITGVVDYAHTPDALQNVLTTLHEISTGKNKIITVIGCGGDRDKTKRPMMAKIATEMSSKVILTSDNPRSENPEEIIRQMEAGVDIMHRKKTLSVTDRKEAIKTACSIAEPGDIILVAGKGHEKYQETSGVRIPFDDKELLKTMFTLMYQ
jgi:UDP-N-acetylmuramoyl-L-alanyl-D-glutamate--2,6-diaminopimelate ligase